MAAECVHTATCYEPNQSMHMGMLIPHIIASYVGPPCIACKQQALPFFPLHLQGHMGQWGAEIAARCRGTHDDDVLRVEQHNRVLVLTTRRRDVVQLY